MSSGRPCAVVQSVAPSLGWTLLTGKLPCLSLRDPGHREACQQCSSSLPLLVQCSVISQGTLCQPWTNCVHMLEVFNMTSSLLTSFFFRELLVFIFYFFAVFALSMRTFYTGLFGLDNSSSFLFTWICFLTARSMFCFQKKVSEVEECEIFLSFYIATNAALRLIKHYSDAFLSSKLSQQ